MAEAERAAQAGREAAEAEHKAAESKRVERKAEAARVAEAERNAEAQRRKAEAERVAQAERKAKAEHVAEAAPASPARRRGGLGAGGAAGLLEEAAAVLGSVEPAGELRGEVCELLARLARGSRGGGHDLERWLRARAPQWLPRLDALAGQLESEAWAFEARAQQVDPEGVLDDARTVCSAAGPAVQRMQTELGAAAATRALTLKDELQQFASDAASGACRGGPLADPGLAEAASELWAGFGGSSEGYAAFVEEAAGAPCAGEALGAGAAWRRLLAEVEVALLLAHAGGQAAACIGLAQTQAQNGSSSGSPHLEDTVAKKLMMSVVLPPLQRRARYAAARVQWWLRRQAALALERMQGPDERLPSHLHSRCRAALCSRPVASLVEEAMDAAAAAASTRVLSDLDAVLAAGCLHPRLLLLPDTQPDQGPGGLQVAPQPSAKRRVLEEMLRRASAPASRAQTRALVAAGFRRLRTAVAGKAVGLALVAQAAFTGRLIDEAARGEGLGGGQAAALKAEHERLRVAAERAAYRAAALRRCQGWLRGLEA
ncbi:unnamed protein product [Prorocentrum cordatum]|uniref:Uncharacterized protein n=1 Tax=Prorocentrum cordatum TaxID=2364126 RepID=A0ABN9SAD6_9DINO|nr:unnamed protein product [Polarella glacialis]